MGPGSGSLDEVLAGLGKKKTAAQDPGGGNGGGFHPRGILWPR